MREEKGGDEEESGLRGLKTRSEVSHESVLHHHVGASLFFGVNPQRIEQRTQRIARTICGRIQSINQRRNGVLNELEEVWVVFHVDPRLKLHPNVH